MDLYEILAGSQPCSQESGRKRKKTFASSLLRRTHVYVQMTTQCSHKPVDPISSMQTTTSKTFETRSEHMNSDFIEVNYDFGQLS